MIESDFLSSGCLPAFVGTCLYLEVSVSIRAIFGLSRAQTADDLRLLNTRGLTVAASGAGTDRLTSIADRSRIAFGTALGPARA